MTIQRRSIGDLPKFFIALAAVSALLLLSPVSRAESVQAPLQTQLGGAHVSGTFVHGLDWAEPFTVECAWEDVCNEFGDFAAAGDGAPDFLDTWGSYGAGSNALFVDDDVSGGSDFDATCIAEPDDNPCTRDVCAGTCSNDPQNTCENDNDCGGGVCQNLVPSHLPEPDGVFCGTQGVCEKQDTCLNGVCHDNGYADPGTACGSSNNWGCDAPDTCDGAGTCVDNKKPDGTACDDCVFCNGADTCSGGACTMHAGDPCTTGGECANVCDEAHGTCNLPSGTACTDTTPLDCKAAQCDGAGLCDQNHANQSVNMACGSSAVTDCDNPDTCDNAGVCQPNHEADGTFCGTQGVCEKQDTCLDGVCHDNGYADPGTACGSSNNWGCDAPDTCDGAGTCVDNKKPDGTACDDCVFCNGADTCSGGACTMHAGDPCTTGGECANVCDEAHGTCNLPSGTACTDTTPLDCKAAQCDGAGLCDQNHANQPVNAACGDHTSGQCDNPDTCDANGVCLPNHVANGTNCGDAGTECVNQDTCFDGVCHDNGYKPSGTTCTDTTPLDCKAAQCDGAGLCDQNHANQPVNAACGDHTSGQCDNPDTCDNAGVCQPNHVANGTNCGDAGTECVNQDTCFDGVCHDNGYKPSGTTCTDTTPLDCKAAQCDGAGLCDQNHANQPVNAACGDHTSGQCDNPDTCDANGVCLPNHVANGTNCGDAGTECVNQDTCLDGVCHDNGYKPSGTTCTDTTPLDCKAAQCDGAGLCDQNHANQPVNAACGDHTSGQCDNPDTCDANGVCLPNHVANGTNCGDAGTECVNQDTCLDGVCHDNGYKPSGTTCTDTTPLDCKAAQCDGAGLCDQNHANQPVNAACGDHTSGQCDNPDTCDNAGVCQPNHVANGTNCGDAGTECVNQDTCLDGVCHDNGYKPSGTTCTDTTPLDCKAAQCDGAGLCDQNHANQPVNAACGDHTSGQCDNPDTCDNAGVCQPNHVANGTNCGDAGTECVNQDTCLDGVCHDNGYKPSGTTCTDTTPLDCKAAQCDGAGLCDQNHANQPVNAACGDHTSGQCDNPDTCDANGVCLPNHVANGTNCGDAGTECVNQDTCLDGVCHDNGYKPSGTTCTDTTPLDCKAAQCDGAGLCDQNHANQPVNAACGDHTSGQCDNPDTCDANGVCLPNHVANGTNCGDAGTECVNQDTCLDGVCHDNGYKPSGTTCTDTTPLDCKAAQCDGAGLCDQNHANQPVNAACGDHTSGQCDNPDTCDANGVCLPNHVANGTNCGDAGTECVNQDTCLDGVCHDNGYKPSGTTCTDTTPLDCKAAQCDGAGLCDQNHANQPVNAACGDHTSGQCDNPDTCDANGVCLPNHVANGTNCGDAGTECVNQDTCLDGVCHDNGYKPSGTTCTDTTPLDCKAAQCDGAGLCDQNHANQPVNAACGDHTSGQCDNPDTCDANGVCLPNHVANGTNCGDAGTECVNQDTCLDGVCHDNGYKPSGTACTDTTPLDCKAAQCDGAGLCDQNHANQPVNAACGDHTSGQCDNPDTCDANGVCLPNHVANGTNCGDAGTECVNQDTCLDGVCHDNGYKPSGTTCTDTTPLDCKAAQCDGAGLCDQNHANQPVNAACGDHTSGQCDNPDTCDNAGVCLPNHVANGTNCGDAGTDCVNQDTCLDGVCHDNGYKPSGTTCTDTTPLDCKAAQCDGAGLCDQNHANQPVNAACGDHTSGQCDNPDTCDNAGVCLPNHEADGTNCGVAGTECKNQDTCLDGVCHDNGYKPSSEVCRPSVGPCDVAESCSGASADCPPDGYMPQTTVCRASAGPCDVAESCTGNNPLCPNDLYMPQTTICRPSAGVCDVAETCTGSGPQCPDDGYMPQTTTCRPSAGPCDVAESCTGNSPLCPPDGFLPRTTICRPSTGSCDLAESCSGSSADCPPDVQLPYTAHASVSSDFNGTSIRAGRYIWFNANFKASGVGPGMTTIQWVNSTITFKVGNQTFTLAVPDSQIIFDPSAACATTTFNVALNRWETRVPVSGCDEIFLSGLAFLVPYDFPGGIKPVAWTGDFIVDHAGVSVGWKWGAAVYANTNMSDYNAIGVKPSHCTTCLYSNSDHAGTPENRKSFVVGGARGGGGSNYTGSWSGTQSEKLACQPGQPLNSGPVTGLQFVDTQTLTWGQAQNATVYDILRGDLAGLRDTGGVGGAYCEQDDLDATQVLDDFVPEPGQGLFYLIRGDAISPAPGTYDDTVSPPFGQETRDSKLGTSGGADCTHRQP